MLVRIASDAPWAATVSVAVYTAFIAVVAGFLTLGDFPPPALPLLLLPAVVVDMAMRRHWPAVLTATIYTLALHAAYVPVRNLLGDGVRFTTTDVLAGAMLTLVATLVVFALATRGRDEPGHRSQQVRAGTGAAAAASVLLVLLLAPVALAHDPGQGEDAGTVAMRVTRDDARAALSADLSPRVCDSTQPRAVVARRGGETLRATLTKRGCRLQGTLRLPERGRWLVYAEMRRGGRAVESWLPIAIGSGPRTVSAADRYAYFPLERSDGTSKLIASVVLYGGMLALLYATFVLVRGSRTEREPASTAAVRT